MCGHRGRFGIWGQGRTRVGKQCMVKGNKIARIGKEKRKGVGEGEREKREIDFVRQCSAHASPIPSCKWDLQLIYYIFC